MLSDVGAQAGASASPMSSPSAQFSLILRVELERGLDVIGRVTSAIGDAGGQIGAIDIVESGPQSSVRSFTVDTTDREHGDAIVTAIDAVAGARVVEVTDRTFELHRGGKLYTGLRARIQSRDDLSMAYTPGVARVCMDIHDERDKAWEYTIKGNSVAVVSDGTAVPSVTTATVFCLMVSARALSTSAAMARQTRATPGV